MRSNLAYIRWHGHEKFVSKHIRFKPEYAEMMKRLCKDQNVTQRELIESALKSLYGEPKKEGI